MTNPATPMGVGPPAPAYGFEAFADPWEHVRLLSDGNRNQALLDLLHRHAPGRRVLEVGTGTGLLACAAARMGAARVYAVEPTSMWEHAKALVEVNGLQDVVEVIPGRIQDVEPRPVDLAFAEMLNANPYLEEPLECADAAMPWVVPGGLLAPHRLQVWVALAACRESVAERDDLLAELRRIGETYRLELLPTSRVLKSSSPWSYVSRGERPASSCALAHDLALGTGARPPEEKIVRVVASRDGLVGGAMVWFVADLDRGLRLENAPPDGGHWGTMACAWTVPTEVKAGQRVALAVRVTGHDLTVALAR